LVVGPLQVLEDEHERAPLRERLDEAPPRGEALGLLARLGRREAGERRESALQPLPFGLVERKLVERRGELRGRLGRRVRLEHSELGLHDLAERPHADSLAERERAPAPPRHQLLVRLDDREELGDEAALPDSGTPATVTSCGSRSRRVRSNAPTRRSSSVPLPTSGPLETSSAV